MIMYHYQNVGQNHDLEMDYKSFSQYIWKWQ